MLKLTRMEKKSTISNINTKLFIIEATFRNIINKKLRLILVQDLQKVSCIIGNNISFEKRIFSMKSPHLLPFLLILLTLSSCDILMKVANDAMQGEAPLTSEQVASGLKQALEVGAREAVKQLNTQDGYYMNPALKIALPAETQEILQNAKKIPGVDQLLERLVLQLNRSAEDAAKMAQPILVNAITAMSITDAWGILRGEQNAATQYLRKTTFQDLTDLYSPVIKKSLDKPLVAGISATQTWNEITSKWNDFAKSLAGSLLGAKPLNYSLEEYVTVQALTGLFYQIEVKEKVIRTDISARTTDLMRRVFASTGS